MKTFEDLEFEPWGKYSGIEDLVSLHPEAKHAILNFPNGYSISVIFSSADDDFYSNGIDTYEVSVIKDGRINYDIYPDVLGFQTKEQINQVIAKIQML